MYKVELTESARQWHKTVKNIRVKHVWVIKKVYRIGENAEATLRVKYRKNSKDSFLMGSGCIKSIC